MNKQDIEYSIADIEAQLIFIHEQMQENLEKIAEFRNELKNFMERNVDDE